MVKLLTRSKAVSNSIKGDYVPVVRNSLNWGSRLYNEIRKGVSIYYNYRREDMYTHHIELEDLIQSVAITLYRWRNFNPEISDNAFAYITSVCRNAFAKGWRQLGKIQCPDSMRVPISDDIYSL